MRRRNFLKLLGLSFVAPKAAISALRYKPKAAIWDDSYIKDSDDWYLQPKDEGKAYWYEHTTYGGGFTVRRDKIESPDLQSFEQAVLRKQERLVAKVFNDAFTTRYRS